MILTIISIIEGNYTLEELKGNIHIEEEAKVYLYHETWLPIIGINFMSNDMRPKAIDNTIQLTETACSKKYAAQYEVQLIRK